MWGKVFSWRDSLTSLRKNPPSLHVKIFICTRQLTPSSVLKVGAKWMAHLLDFFLFLLSLLESAFRSV